MAFVKSIPESGAAARLLEIFELLDFVIFNLMLPINALLIAIFAGWIMSSKACLEESGLKNNVLFVYLRFILRYVAPIVIGPIFYTRLTRTYYD